MRAYVSYITLPGDIVPMEEKFSQVRQLKIVHDSDILVAQCEGGEGEAQGPEVANALEPVVDHAQPPHARAVVQSPRLRAGQEQDFEVFNFAQLER